MAVSSPPISDNSIKAYKVIMWKKNLGGCLMVLVAIVGFYVAITLSFTFWALPLAFIIFFACLILISLALGPGDRR